MKAVTAPPVPQHLPVRHPFGLQGRQGRIRRGLPALPRGRAYLSGRRHRRRLAPPAFMALAAGPQRTWSRSCCRMARKGTTINLYRGQSRRVPARFSGHPFRRHRGRRHRHPRGRGRQALLGHSRRPVRLRWSTMRAGSPIWATWPTTRPSSFNRRDRESPGLLRLAVLVLFPHGPRSRSRRRWPSSSAFQEVGGARGTQGPAPDGVGSAGHNPSRRLIGGIKWTDPLHQCGRTG